MEKNIKLYRFFYHYRRSDKKMSVHFKNQCISAVDIECTVPCETKRNKIQPFLVLQGFAKEVVLINEKLIIR
jgi:hypothetical protein